MKNKLEDTSGKEKPLTVLFDEFWLAGDHKNVSADVQAPEHFGKNPVFCPDPKGENYTIRTQLTEQPEKGENA